MKKTLLTLGGLLFICFLYAKETSEQLPYKKNLSTTLSSTGSLPVSPVKFCPQSDFSIHFTATLSPESQQTLTARATNAAAIGFELTLGPKGIASNETEQSAPLYPIALNDGKEHEYRIALHTASQKVFIYVDGLKKAISDARYYGNILFPSIFDSEDNASENKGIYHPDNFIANPGFEEEEINWDFSITGKENYMFWPLKWEIYKGNSKNEQWNLGVRCYKDADLFANQREGKCALMFRQDGGGGFTQGSAIYQKLSAPLKANRKYRIAFEGMSHSNASGYSFAIGVGPTPGNWTYAYYKFNTPSTVLTAENYSYDFTAPEEISEDCYLGIICADNKGIIHLDRITLVEAEGNYSQFTLTPEEEDTPSFVLGSTSYEAAAWGSEKVLTNQLVNGGEYHVYSVAYDRLLGVKEDGKTPGISQQGASPDSLSYVFVAESGPTTGQFRLKQKSSGNYFAANTSNTYGTLYTTATEKHTLWEIATGTKGSIKSVYGGKYLGCDAGRTEKFVSVWCDKAFNDYSTWQIIEVGFPLAESRLQLYTAALSAAITEGEAVYENPAFGALNQKEELAQALYNGRSAYETASLKHTELIILATDALKAAIANCKENNYKIWISGNSFPAASAFTVALKGTSLKEEDGMNAQFIIRNSQKTGANVIIGHGYLKVNNQCIKEDLNNQTGKHDYHFAFNGTQLTVYFDGQEIGSCAQIQLPATTSVGTNAEWTVLGINALKSYNPEIISLNKAYAPSDIVKNANGKPERISLKIADQQITLRNEVDYHILAESEAMVESSIDICNEDAWVIFENIHPSDVTNRHLSAITINGQSAVNGTNCRVAIYLHGTAIIPHNNTYEAFQGFSGELYNGQTYSFGVGKAEIGKATNNIRSFILRRGYMVCLATQSDGGGYSRVYVADHKDKMIDKLPELLNGRISYIYVRQWNYVSKKGWCNTSSTSSINTEGKMMGTTWFYTWSSDRNTQPDMEYVPHKGHIYWPGWSSINNNDKTTAVLGYNEPDHSEQHEKGSCSCGGIIDPWKATTHAPEFFESGLRIGSPSPTDAGWLTQYIQHCNNMGYRCDFVSFHSYWGTNEAPDATSWKNQLQSIYNSTKRPIWLTEWNNGASWTTETWPTSYSDKLAKQKNAIVNILKVLDECDFIERYSIYNWDSYYRAMMSWDGNKNNWWITPAGEVYRDNRPSFAYKENMQFVPIGWFPSFKKEISFSFELKIAGPKLQGNLTNPNGDFTGEQAIEYQKEDGSYDIFYLEKDRSLFDNTKAYSITLPLDSTQYEALTTDSLTLRLKVTSIKGDIAYSAPTTVEIPNYIRNKYGNLTSIEHMPDKKLKVTGGARCIHVNTNTPQEILIYNLNGSLAYRVWANDKKTTINNIKPGIYIINKIKITVK